MSKSSIGWRKAGISSLATAALVAGACVAGAGAASATTGFTFHRVNGTDRYGTSAAVAKEFGATSGATSQAPRATDVILASGLSGHYPDALAANYLAGVKKAPVLLTNKNNTPPAVLQAIKDTGASTVWIVGGTGVISQGQEDALVSDGYTVHRISGTNRFETATDVIKQGGTAASGEGIVATGLNFPDALGAGPLAYAKGMPLAISKQYSISQDEIDALKAAGVTKVLIVGGTKAVSNAVATQLAANNITVDQRLSGTNRSATAEAVANYEVKNGFTKTAVNVASGFEQGDGADALGGGALSGSTNTPMLITMDDIHPGAATLDYLTQNANTLASGDLFGGTAAISDAAAKQMETAAQQVNSNQSYTVAPQDKATFGATNDTKSQRSYTVTGLDNTKTYNVALFEAGNVDTSSPQVKFTDAGKDGKADQGTVAAKITSVNNVGTGASGLTNATATPVNGVVQFTVNSDAPDDVVPVVWLDNSTGTPAALDVNADGTPSEAFGVGGETVYTPQGATAGPVNGATVQSNDETANTFVAGTGSTAASYAYDANDTYYVGSIAPANQVTMATFEKDLNAGDLITTAYYQTNPDFTTTWVLTDQSPSQPQAVTVTPTAKSEDSSLTVAWTAPAKGTPDSYNVYRATGAPTAVNYPTDYKLVGTVDGKTLKYVDSGLKASQQYSYVVTAVEQGEESTPAADTAGTKSADEATGTTAATPAPAAKITSAQLTSDAVTEGAPSAGDVWTLVFNQDVSGLESDGLVRLQDGNGDIFEVQCGGTAGTTAAGSPQDVAKASCVLGTSSGSSVSNNQVTITLIDNPADRNAAGDSKLTYPANIVALTSATSGVTVDVAGSSDVTIG